LSDYRAGASLGDLQKSYSLSRGSVQKILRKWGVVRQRRKSLTDPEVAELVERYDAGLRIRKIAIERHLPKSTTRAGVEMRVAGRRKESTK